MEKKELMVVCPICKKRFAYYSVKSRPFCSERCKDIDLAKWASEEYCVPTNSPLTPEDIEEVVRFHSTTEGDNE